MHFTDDSFVIMLLTMALSPDKEEYAKPLTGTELNQLRIRVSGSNFHTLGALIGKDISALMLELRMSEDEAFRLYTLLNRGMQLSYALEAFMRRGFEVMTSAGRNYPIRLNSRLKDALPPLCYTAGNTSLLESSMIAIIGISGVKTSPQTIQYIDSIVGIAARNGYTIVTGGEPGVSRVALGKVIEYGGKIIEVLGGGLAGRVEDEGIRPLLLENRAAVISLVHPDALFTIPHAAARNKMIFALADAAFIFNTDGKRGESEAVKNRFCPYIYVSDNCEALKPLLVKGALPMPQITDESVQTMIDQWHDRKVEQISLFDLFGS